MQHLPNDCGTTEFVAGGINGEGERNENAVQYKGMGPVCDQSSAHATGKNIDRDAKRDEETRCDSVHACEVGDGSRAAEDEHGYLISVLSRLARLTRDNNVGRQTEKEKSQMSEFAPSDANDFEKGMAVRSVLLEFGGNHGKQEDCWFRCVPMDDRVCNGMSRPTLNSRARSVPPRSANSKLVRRGTRLKERSSPCPSRDNTRSDQAGGNTARQYRKVLPYANKWSQKSVPSTGRAKLFRRGRYMGSIASLKLGDAIHVNPGFSCSRSRTEEQIYSRYHGHTKDQSHADHHPISSCLR